MKIDIEPLMERIDYCLSQGTSEGSRGNYADAVEWNDQADALITVLCGMFGMTFTRDTRIHYRHQVLKGLVKKFTDAHAGSESGVADVNEIRYQAIMDASRSTELSSYVQNTLVSIANRVRTGGEV